MNKCIITGRICKDIDLKTTKSGSSVCNFTVASERKYKNADGNKETDFINCCAWKKSAEFLSKYFTKGSQILIVGELHQKKYETSEGQKISTYEVLIDEIQFIGSKGESEAQNHIDGGKQIFDGFEEIDDLDPPF